MESSPSIGLSGRTNIPVADAEQAILEAAAVARKELGDEFVPRDGAVGRVLAEPVIADRSFPPYDRVSMDGIAISFSALERGSRRFRVAAMQPAGAPPQSLSSPDECIEVMTGAVLPDGCDCVIPVEEISRTDDFAFVSGEATVRKGANIFRAGSDYARGDRLIDAGVRVGPVEIAVCATVGKSYLRVTRHPRIAVVSTGDELVPPDRSPLPHQIRISNSYAVAASLRSRGYRDIQTFHAPDDRPELEALLGRILAEFQVVVTSGGVSMGRFDLLPGVLAGFGITPRFHKVTQRPGRPLWFGAGPANNGDTAAAGRTVTVFGLPGNPVSTTVCAVRYVVPFLDAATAAGARTATQDRRNSDGAPRSIRPRQPGSAPGNQTAFAVLTEDFGFEPPLTMFLPVATDYSTEGVLHATPKPVHGSGDFARLSESDGFLELPAGTRHFAAGTAWPYYPWM